MTMYQAHSIVRTQAPILDRYSSDFICDGQFLYFLMADTQHTIPSESDLGSFYQGNIWIWVAKTPILLI